MEDELISETVTVAFRLQEEANKRKGNIPLGECLQAAAHLVAIRTSLELFQEFRNEIAAIKRELPHDEEVEP